MGRTGLSQSQGEKWSTWKDEDEEEEKEEEKYQEKEKLTMRASKPTQTPLITVGMDTDIVSTADVPFTGICSHQTHNMHDQLELE